MDRRQWCVKASADEAAMFTALANQHGITVPELLRRGAWLLFTLDLHQNPTNDQET